MFFKTLVLNLNQKEMKRNTILVFGIIVGIFISMSYYSGYSISSVTENPQIIENQVQRPLIRYQDNGPEKHQRRKTMAAV